MEHIAAAAPDVLVKAVRHSGLVLRPAPVRHAELDRLSSRHPEIAELRRVLFVFVQALLDRQQALQAARAPFETATPFDLLIQASLHAFEHLVPGAMSSPWRDPEGATAEQTTWDAIKDILLWKLERASADELDLTEAAMGRALALHLAPVLKARPGLRDAGQPMREAFRALVEAQTELNEFMSRSADAFSYDDAIRFVRHWHGAGDRGSGCRATRRLAARWA